MRGRGGDEGGGGGLCFSISPSKNTILLILFVSCAAIMSYAYTR